MAVAAVLEASKDVLQRLQLRSRKSVFAGSEAVYGFVHHPRRRKNSSNLCNSSARGQGSEQSVPNHLRRSVRVSVRAVLRTYSIRTEQNSMLSTSNSYGSDSVNAQTMPFLSDGLCFPHRVPIAFLGHLVTPMHLQVARLKDSLSELSECQVTALGQLLPSLLCGEESAFQVFWREGHGFSNVQINRSEALASQIALEELEHERLLQDLRGCCPVPSDVASSLVRTRRFFVRMASRDPAVHFARVAALDSAVCIILSTLAKPLSRATALIEIFNRIRSDEARHVRFSRRHSYELGAEASLLAKTAACISGELVTLLYPLGGAFEDLGVDADHLFRRMNKQNGSIG
jgi:hypothetical protein